MSTTTQNRLPPVSNGDELAQLKAQLEAANAKIAALQSAPIGKLTLKVSKRGAISLYGLGRMPITLYASQWEALAKFMAAGEKNAVAAFIATDPVGTFSKDDFVGARNTKEDGELLQSILDGNVPHATETTSGHIQVKLSRK